MFRHGLLLWDIQQIPWRGEQHAQSRRAGAHAVLRGAWHRRANGARASAPAPTPVPELSWDLLPLAQVIVYDRRIRLPAHLPARLPRPTNDSRLCVRRPSRASGSRRGLEFRRQCVDGVAATDTSRMRSLCSRAALSTACASPIGECSRPRLRRQQFRASLRPVRSSSVRSTPSRRGQRLRSRRRACSGGHAAQCRTGTGRIRHPPVRRRDRALSLTRLSPMPGAMTWVLVVRARAGCIGPTPACPTPPGSAHGDGSGHVGHLAHDQDPVAFVEAVTARCELGED